MAAPHGRVSQKTSRTAIEFQKIALWQYSSRKLTLVQELRILNAEVEADENLCSSRERYHQTAVNRGDHRGHRDSDHRQGRTVPAGVGGIPGLRHPSGNQPT